MLATWVIAGIWGLVSVLAAADAPRISSRLTESFSTAHGVIPCSRADAKQVVWICEGRGGDRVYYFADEIEGRTERRFVARFAELGNREGNWKVFKPAREVGPPAVQFDDEQGAIRVLGPAGQALPASEVDVLAKLMTRQSADLSDDYKRRRDVLSMLSALEVSQGEARSALLAEILEEPSDDASPLASLNPHPRVEPLEDPVTHEALRVSVLSPRQLREAFDWLRARSEIAFGYPEEGCYSRAHQMARLLEDRGVYAAKAFLQGSLKAAAPLNPKGYVRWAGHVAPVVWVAEKGEGGERLVSYVLDPSIVDEPVPVARWIAAMDQGRPTQLSYGSRYMMFPDESRAIRGWKGRSEMVEVDLRYYRTLMRSARAQGR